MKQLTERLSKWEINRIYLLRINSRITSVQLEIEAALTFSNGEAYGKPIGYSHRTQSNFHYFLYEWSEGGAPPRRDILIVEELPKAVPEHTDVPAIAITVWWEWQYPPAWTCPMSLISQASPPYKKLAGHWRERCASWSRKQTRNKQTMFSVGMILKFKEKIAIDYKWREDTFRISSTKRGVPIRCEMLSYPLNNGQYRLCKLSGARLAQREAYEIVRRGQGARQSDTSGKV